MLTAQRARTIRFRSSGQKASTASPKAPSGNWKTIFSVLLLTAFGTDLLQNEVGKALVAIATNSDQIADTFQKHHSKLYQDGIAFRYNVGQGLETIGLEEATKMDDIQAATRRYIQTQDVYTSLASCSEKLKRGACMLDFS